MANTRRRPGSWRGATLAVVALSVVGCKAAPAADSGFLATSGGPMRPEECAPFHRVWYDRSAPWAEYDRLVVEPVDTACLAPRGAWDQVSVASLVGDPAEDAVETAAYLREAVRREAAAAEGGLQLAEAAGPRTLLLELAVVELVPTKVWLNLLAYAALWTGVDRGSVAIEARLRDATTGAVVATLADRERGPVAPFSLADLTWYAHARNICDDWAAQLVASLNAPGADVPDTWPVTLRPW
jgi:hypothetical protein